jgi:hypothetical protein
MMAKQITARIAPAEYQPDTDVPDTTVIVTLPEHGDVWVSVGVHPQHADLYRKAPWGRLYWEVWPFGDELDLWAPASLHHDAEFANEDGPLWAQVWRAAMEAVDGDIDR